MPRGLRRYQHYGHLHFITFSCYGRRPSLNDDAAKDVFISTLEQTRIRFAFEVIGYVVMPDHVHLLISEPEETKLSTAIQWLKQNSSRVIRKLPRDGTSNLMRFWQRRYFDFNVWTSKKRIEKLRYIHRNPVRRGLVSDPEDWEWSSYNSYLLDLNLVVKLNI